MAGEPRMRLGALGLALGLVSLLGSCSVPDFKFQSGNGGDASADGPSGGTGGTGTDGGGTGGSSGTAGTGGIAGAAGTGGTTPSCTTHADCTATPQTPKCNPSSGSCVQCLPSEDECPDGYYCASIYCQPGCKTNDECPAPLVCDPTVHKCLGCGQDDDCPPGQLCETSSTACIPGCTPSHACESGWTCCSGSCALLPFDVNNCGECGKVCPTPPAGTGLPICSSPGVCGVKCEVLFSKDCNGDWQDGCEVDLSSDPSNCGDCGKSCDGGQCVNKTCS